MHPEAKAPTTRIIKKIWSKARRGPNPRIGTWKKLTTSSYWRKLERKASNKARAEDPQEEPIVKPHERESAIPEGATVRLKLWVYPVGRDAYKVVKGSLISFGEGEKLEDQSSNETPSEIEQVENLEGSGEIALADALTSVE